MTRLRNLDYTTCKICGCVSNYTPCPQCLKAEAEREAEQPKRVVMVQHDGGQQEIEPDWVRPGYIQKPHVTIETAEQAAADKRFEYRAWLAELERGSGCAGNEPESCEAGGFG